MTKRPAPRRQFAMRLSPDRQELFNRVAVTGIPHSEVVVRLYSAYVDGKIQVPGLPPLRSFQLDEPAQ